jgi:hypothetical protein
VARPLIRDFEDVAADLVASAERGQWRRTDGPGAGSGTHDFEVNCSDGRVLALEVTTSAVGADMSMWRAIAKENWECPGLRCSWAISVELPSSSGSTPNIKRLRREIERLLAALQAQGVDSFDTFLEQSRRPDQACGEVLELGSLGVARGRAVPGLTGGGVPLVHLGSSGGFVTAPDEINDVVAEEAAHNVEKLRRAEASERHVFVWIHPTSGGPELNLWQGDVPRTSPELPVGIDVAWIARFPEEGREVTHLWRVRPAATWEVLRQRAP